MLIFLEDVADENLISEIKAVSTKARLAVGTCFDDRALATFANSASA
jgi:hypothetical protein